MKGDRRARRIHKLFNELHKEVGDAAFHVSQDTSREYIELESEIDRLHHFFTDLIEYEAFSS